MNDPFDRIINLPKSIRNHIISFLPMEMEDAVRTSILSKQWRNVCSTLSTLRFDHITLTRKFVNKNFNFVDFVDHILSSHDESDIQRFHLIFKVEDSIVSHLNSWISLVVQHNVKEFVLCVCFGKLETPIPDCLFSCRTLKMLELYLVSLSLPETIEFSMLKVLKLTSVKFSDYNQIDRLISSCPLLEDLSINLYIKCDDNNTLIVISAANLKKLFLTITTIVVIEVQICCRNLHSIQYLGSPPDIHPEVLPFLSSDRIQYNPCSIDLASSVYIRHASKILNSLQNVVTLDLDWVCIEDLGRVFIDMLSIEGFWQLQEISGEDAVKNLKTVKVNLFNGGNVEYELVRYLLRNANVLVSMMISYTEELRRDAASQLSVSQKVLEFSRASPYVEISFS